MIRPAERAGANGAAHRLPVAVALSADDAYARPLAATVRSLLAALPSDADATVYLTRSLLDASNQRRIEDSIADLPGRIEWIEFEEARFQGIPTTRRWSRANHVRLVLPDILPAQVERVLVLDSDLIVRADVSPLFEMDLAEAPLAAVEDESIAQRRHSRVLEHVDMGYFNAGVLLFDLPRWRGGVVQEVIDYVVARRHDFKRGLIQDGLNGWLRGRWLALDPRWNVPSSSFHRSEKGLRQDPAWRRAVLDPAIVHFTGPWPRKPWAYKCDHPLRHLYAQAEAGTAWRDAPIEGETLLRRARRGWWQWRGLGPGGRRRPGHPLGPASPPDRAKPAALRGPGSGPPGARPS